jgi:sugar/nucleoside kinase (ribokinase family)
MSKETSHHYDVVAIGNAIVDVLSKTEETFLSTNSINKGTMTLIEADQAESLYAKMGPGMEMSGGSAANTIAAIASFGGRAGYIGKIANDQLGSVFRHDIRAMGVTFDTPPLDSGAPTARCLILITPDAQRTMCTYLGACVWISPSDLDEEMIRNAKVTYLEGYLFDRARAKPAFMRAGEIAKAAGRKTALTLSDPFCVERHRGEFLDLIQNSVDILFANEEEILSLYRTRKFDEAVYHVRQHCEIAAITRSDKGSVIVTRDGIIEIPASPVERVVDTTGAGDLYAAGFLYAYTHGMPLEKCAELGSLAAAEIISHVGARPQSNLAELMRGRLKA